MKIQSYDQIQSWKKGIEITKQIYKITNSGHFLNDKSLSDQMRRSAVSISSNIAEGFERNSNNEFTRFLTIAKGSAGELRTQITISYQICYLTKNEYESLIQEISATMNLLGSFISYLRTIKQTTRKPVTRKPANT